MSDVKLPPMPPNYHGWWKHQKTERITLNKQEPCSHDFFYTNEGVECRICHTGLLGKGLEIRNGKLYINKANAH